MICEKTFSRRSPEASAYGTKMPEASAYGSGQESPNLELSEFIFKTSLAGSLRLAWIFHAFRREVAQVLSWQGM